MLIADIVAKYSGWYKSEPRVVYLLLIHDQVDKSAIVPNVLTKSLTKYLKTAVNIA